MRMMTARFRGSAYTAAAPPSGSSTVSAASGPYAAEPRASRPKIGIPAAAPIRCSGSSSEASGRPNNTSAIAENRDFAWSAMACFPHSHSVRSRLPARRLDGQATDRPRLYHQPGDGSRRRKLLSAPIGHLQVKDRRTRYRRDAKQEFAKVNEKPWDARAYG